MSSWIPPSLTSTSILSLHPSAYILRDSPSHGHHPDLGHRLLSTCCLSRPLQPILHSSAEWLLKSLHWILSSRPHKTVRWLPRALRTNPKGPAWVTWLSPPHTQLFNLSNKTSSFPPQGLCSLCVRLTSHSQLLSRPCLDSQMPS